MLERGQRGPDAEATQGVQHFPLEQAPLTHSDWRLQRIEERFYFPPQEPCEVHHASLTVSLFKYIPIIPILEKRKAVLDD